MEWKQVIVQRAREFFGNRLNEVVRFIRQDRQYLLGMEEPEHFRAVIRRVVSEGAPSVAESTEVALAEETAFGRGAGEPDLEHQRATCAQLLETGGNALAQIVATSQPELTKTEQVGLEFVLLLYGRPALLIRQGRLVSTAPFWNELAEHREGIELAQRGVGRIELMGHPEYDWAGTGFLVNDTCLMTTKQTAEIFAQQTNAGTWQFRQGISGWMDYRSLYRPGTMAGYRIRQILGVHDQWDLALLEVEPPHRTADAPIPLYLAAQAPTNLEGRSVYLVGYPERDQRRNEPEVIARIFRDVYNVKRVQPGTIRGMTTSGECQMLQHDCAMLGRMRGACLLDMETHQVLGLHLAGRYLETGCAIPLWQLRNDPLLTRCGVNFAGTTAGSDFKIELTRKFERLLNSRFWADTQAAINNLYQRAFGTEETAKGK